MDPSRLRIDPSKPALYSYSAFAQRVFGIENIGANMTASAKRCNTIVGEHGVLEGWVLSGDAFATPEEGKFDVGLLECGF